MMKCNRFKFFVFFMSIILILIGCSSSREDSNVTSLKENAIKVHYIDVGQGDSILIQVNNKNLLIDAGTTDSTDKLLSYLSKQNISRLDYVIATHPHEDHIGGMAAIIRKFKIGQFYAPRKTASTRTFENMINALKSKNLKINTAKEGVTIDLEKNAECVMLAPNSDNYDSTNNYSAVLKITYGNSNFLFMGDAEKLSEREILSKNLNVNCDMLKVGHHGSTSSSSPEFLDRVSPKIAVISCGKSNDYGHPHKPTIKALNNRKIQIYRTDIDGNIIFVSGGNDIIKE
jgi:competence protein ComEC